MCWAQWSSVSPAQCRTAIQQALAIWTRVADHLRWHLGSLLAYRWMFHSSCRWSGPGPSPTSRCISRNQTEHLKSGLHLKQVLEGVLSSNSFVLMQLQKGKRYFCLAIQWVLWHKWQTVWVSRVEIKFLCICTCSMQVLTAFSTRLIAWSSVPAFTVHVNIIYVCPCAEAVNVVSHGQHSKTSPCNTYNIQI